MKTQCPHCEAVYNIPDVYQDKQINCPKCKEAFTARKYEGANKAQKVEHCENCGRAMGKLERGYIYEGQVVCKQCNESLRHPLYITQTKSVSGLGIAALVLGLVACLGCWIPFCGIFSLPFAILGILFGVIGIIIAKLKKRSYVGLPMAGTIVSVTAAFIVIAVTGSIASSIEKSSRTIAEGLDKTRDTLSSPKVEGTITYGDDEEKQPYIDNANWEIIDITTKITEQNSVYWQFAWRLTVKNNLARTINLSGKIEFQDAEGFIVDTDSLYSIIVPANSSKTFTGAAMVSTSIAPKIAGTVVKLHEGLF